MKFYMPKHKQLDLDLLRSTLDRLDKANRCAALGDLLAWAELEKGWTGMCYFVKNVMKFLRELCLVLTEIWRILIAIATMRRYVCSPQPVTVN